MLNAHAVTAWDMFSTIYPSLAKQNHPTIFLNNRFTRTAGVCKVEQNRIELGYKFFENHAEEMFCIILPHEIAHQIDYNLHGLPKNNRWHGKTWQQIMVNFGLKPELYHAMEF